MRGIENGQHVSELVGLELADGGEDFRVALESGLGNEAHVAAVGSGVGILREVHGDGGKIFAAFEAIVEDLNFLFCVGVA